MAEHDMSSLWDRWIELWNGDLELGEAIVHPEFELHRIPPPHIPDAPNGRTYLLTWVRETRSFFDDLRFTVVVGPVVDGEMVAGRWVAEGGYQGGIPGSTAPVGTRVRFHGNDIWRAENGQVREYWLSDDLFDLAMQIGVIPAG
ncbi:MAG: ester cyclase [Actinomycetota bacterium]